MDSIPHGTFSGYSFHKCKCAECVGFKKARDAEYYAANRERVKARVAASRAADPEKHRARVRAREAELPEAERQRRRERDAEWRKTAEQRAKGYARSQKYFKTEKGRLAIRRSVAKRRGAPLTPEAAEYVEILLRDPCVYCGGEAEEIDHIEPVVNGGTGDWDNLAPACRSCNAQKWTKSLLEFLLERPLAGTGAR